MHRSHRHSSLGRFFIVPALIALSLTAQSIYAQRRPSSAAAIPAPRTVFDFKHDEDRTIIDWKRITNYFGRLDQASDRVQLQTIGKSTLGRTMVAAFISSPENIRTLDKYKAI